MPHPADLREQDEMPLPNPRKDRRRGALLLLAASALAFLPRSAAEPGGKPAVAVPGSEWEDEADASRPPAATGDVLDYYKFETQQSDTSQHMIYEITKYNMLACGAVLFFGGSSFIQPILDGHVFLGLLCVLVAAISLSSSVLIVYYHKYLSASVAKARIIEKALWRQRPFQYIEWKYRREGIVSLYGTSSRLGVWGFVTHGYIMKWVNLIPFLGAVGIFAAAYYWKDDGASAARARQAAQGTTTVQKNAR